MRLEKRPADVSKLVGLRAENLIFPVAVSLNRRSCTAELVETVLPPLRGQMFREFDCERRNCHRQHDNWRNQAIALIEGF
jgi:hypothetical protein